MGSNISSIVAIALVMATLAGLLFGATWLAVLTGLSAIFAGVWWVGDMEKEGRFS